MEKQITSNIDYMVECLNMVKEEVEKGTPERIDTLDILSFVSVALDNTYNKIKEKFGIEE